jgi:hypothetical protein
VKVEVGDNVSAKRQEASLAEPACEISPSIFLTTSHMSGLYALTTLLQAKMFITLTQEAG